MFGAKLLCCDAFLNFYRNIINPKILYENERGKVGDGGESVGDGRDGDFLIYFVISTVYNN